MVLYGYYGDKMILLLKYAVGLGSEYLPVRIVRICVNRKEQWPRIQQTKSFLMSEQACQKTSSVCQKM